VGEGYGSGDASGCLWTKASHWGVSGLGLGVLWSPHGGVQGCLKRFFGYFFVLFLVYFWSIFGLFLVQKYKKLLKKSIKNYTKNRIVVFVYNFYVFFFIFLMFKTKNKTKNSRVGQQQVAIWKLNSAKIKRPIPRDPKWSQDLPESDPSCTGCRKN